MSKRILTTILIIPFIMGFTNIFSSTINRGNRLLNDGKTEEALQLYRDAELDDPQNPLINYNLGVALAAQEKFAEAESEFSKALSTDDVALEAKTYYNLGNTMFRQGRLDEAVKMYEKALSIDVEDDDARYNLELTRKKIKEMLKNQQQQSQEKNQQQQDKEKSSDSEQQDGGQQQQQDAGSEEKKEDNTQQDQEKKEDDGKEKKENDEKQGEGKQPEDEKEAEQQKAGQQPEDNAEEMSREDASRILNALNQEEKDLLRNQYQRPGREAQPDKDW